MFRSLLLAVLLCGAASASTVQEAARLTQSSDYEASEAALAKVKKEDQGPAYYFYKLVNAYSLNRKQEAMKWVEMIEGTFEEVPLRYRDLALIMKADMSVWKDGDADLDDISREMKKAGDRLKNGKGGPQTREIQKAVEKRLEKMIKDAEDAQAAAAKAAEEQQAKKQQESRPAQDTHSQQENGTGQIDNKKVKELAEVWGKLPEKERAKALVELLRGMPPKDKAVVEAYFRELAKSGGK